MSYEVDRLRDLEGNNSTARQPSFPEMVDIILSLLRLNKLMTTFLGLEHHQELETMKRRNISVLEDSLAS
ncbi:hypothetical protein P3T76_002451 [Phytophthora citrophthora]|uniref:Uncharacterized protein n=1 Tax=Phytophthora citrophthora TaxID=4793 RepID=A0AAD9GWC7_9STRA|nr:hypothetical protein P3T76_002451 [Phytophthora citrophthora]